MGSFQARPVKTGLAWNVVLSYLITMFYNLLNSKWVVFCLLAFVVLAVFGRAAWFDYVQLDEGVLLINNQFFISKIANFFEVFKHDINYPSAIAPYYRPIFILSFMLNSQISSSVFSYHIGNILLHMIVVFFVFILLRELELKRETSILFSVLFALHPAVTPVVAWVPGRIEAILTIFTILSFVCFSRFLKTANWRYLTGFFSSFLIALLTKEVVIALLPVLFFYYLTHRQEKGSELWVILLSGIIGILVSWFFIRKAVLAEAGIVNIPFAQIIQIFLSNSSAFILYLGKTILPFNLSVFPVLGSSTLIYGFIVLGIMIGIVFFQELRLRGQDPFLSQKRVLTPLFGFIWFIVFLAPSLISYDLPGRMIFFEHRLYLPMVGIIIFFACFISKSPYFAIWKYQSKLLIGFTIVLFAFLSFNYSGFYKNKISFWQKAVADSPKSSEAHNGLATAYLLDGKTNEAEIEFIKTLELNPNEKRVHLLLGLYYLDQGQHDKAKAEFEKEIQIDSRQFVAYHSLGRIYAQDKNLKEAENYFLKTLELNSKYILARQDLVVLYFSQDKHPQAVAQLKELLKIQRPEAMHPQILEILEIYAKEISSQKGL